MTRMITVASLVLVVLLSGSCEEDDTPEPSTGSAPQQAEQVRHSLEAAEVYIASGNTDRARAILSQLLDRVPGDARPREAMGRLELGRGLAFREQGLIESAQRQFNLAHGWYEKAIILEPGSGGLHQSAGEVAQLAGELEVALACYERARELEPGNPKSSLCAAQLLLERNPAEAERLLLDVLHADPSQPHALASLALARQRQGDSEAALDAASRALAEAGDEVAVRIAVARVHRLDGRPREALELLLALPDRIRIQESAASEIALSWEAIDQPVNAGEAWAACFRGNAFRTDAWRYALRAAAALGRGGQHAVAASWLEQAIMLDAPADQVEGVRLDIAGSRP